MWSFWFGQNEFRARVVGGSGLNGFQPKLSTGQEAVLKWGRLVSLLLLFHLITPDS
ncbi:hypothetical protein Hanom_Chr10g00927061 [Helianthus anomalus]